MVQRFMDAILPKPDPKNVRAVGNNVRARQEIMTLYQDKSVPGVEMSGKSLWGLFNAVTHRTSHLGNDYYKQTSEDKASARMQSLMFGGTRERLNQTAFDACLSLAGQN
jgi:hypothetical protein